MTKNFPIVIEFTGSHGLESGAVEGRDFFRFMYVEAAENLLSIDSEFCIICTNVGIAV